MTQKLSLVQRPHFRAVRRDLPLYEWWSEPAESMIPEEWVRVGLLAERSVCALGPESVFREHAFLLEDLPT